MTPDADSLRAALTLLGGAGCPVCRAADDAESRFFAWFMVETYAERPMVEHLRGSLGFCPRHTRRLLREAPHPGVPNFVFEQVTAAARARLREARPPPLAACPACDSRGLAAERAVQLIVAELHRPEVLAAYEETGGLCVPHGLAALDRSDPGRGRLLAQVLARRLAGGGPATALAGSDPDARDRARLRAGLPREPGDCAAERPAPDHAGTLRLLRGRLRLPACPLCLGLGWMERRYVAWLARGAQDDQARLDLAASLCPTHLHDLVQARPSLDEPVGRRAASLWTGALGRLLAGLTTLPSRTGGFPLPRSRSVWRALRAQVRHALPPCPACSALSVTAEREPDLLARALLDGPTARRFESSHGLCARHALAGPTPPAALDVARARLGLLSWELEEAARKQAWSFRHEAPGPESTAWLRAAALLDGRVFLGGPPARP